MIPAEVTTPRPCLSTVCVGNNDLRWDELTGKIRWTDADGDEEWLDPLHPVVLWYNPGGRYLRFPDGTERLLPELVNQSAYEPDNPDYVYCGLLYTEQVVPQQLKTKTLLVLVAGHHTYSQFGDGICYPENINPGDLVGHNGTNRIGSLGVWLTKNSLFLFPPGQVNRAHR